ncbi:hypothetical protein KSS87_021531 [Heliosperma pusillum]|nr:hypothetical protein KSS87_021531 [Heliosperma pusillum]
MVSSPTTTTTPSNGCGDGIMIKELIGRLGSICDSSSNNNININNINNNNNYNNSTNTSCYNTPLNSPPQSSKFNLSSLMMMGNTNHTIMSNNNANYPTNLGSFNADPGFVERAAKFSCFGNNNSSNFANNVISNNNNNNNNVNNGNNINHEINNNKGDSREGSSVSEQNPVVELSCKPQNDAKSRKRKSISKAKVKDFTPSIKDDKVEVENDASNAKRSKVENELSKKENEGECNSSKVKENNVKNDNNNDSKETEKAEPLKDYIHVRARRGQATDSHSLAERVRREKISERMKFLQDLVPGCNKVTGKATVLDEIINYVQSLQRQVEFLSMKLSTVSPRLECNMEALLSKDMFQSMYQLDQNSAQALPFAYQTAQQMTHPLLNGIPNGFENPFSVSPIDLTGARRNPTGPLPSIDGFVDSLSQLPTLWEDDLQSMVQMGIVPNQTQSVPGTLPNAHMKVEL